MAKKTSKMKPKQLAAKMLLAGATGNLQLFKEYLVSTGFFDGDNKAPHKPIWDLLGDIQDKLRDLRKQVESPKEKADDDGGGKKGKAAD